MAWTLVNTDTFAGRGPQTAGNVGNSWIDNLSVWSINGSTLGTNGLVGTTSTNTQGATVTPTIIYRPSSEFTGAVGHRGSITFNGIPSAGSVSRTVAFVHMQDVNNYYHFYNTGTQIVINKVVAGVQAGGSLAAATFTLVSVPYTLDFWGYQTGPAATTLGFTLTRVSDSAIVASASVVDTTSALQSIGTIGSDVYAVAQGTSSSSNAITSYSWYTGTPPGNATALSLYGPSTGTNGVATSNFTVTPNNSGCSGTCTVTPSDAANGGTFTPTTLTFSAGSITPQTFTYTPASNGTKTISITDSLTLTHTGSPISLVVGAASFTISPTTATARQPAATTNAGTGAVAGPTSGGITVTVTGTSTNFLSSDTWTVSGGFGTSKITATTNSTTSVTLRFDPGAFYIGNPWGTTGAVSWGTLTISNATAGLSQTMTITAPVTAPAIIPGGTGQKINVLFIGDSISASDVSGGDATDNTYGLLSQLTMTALKNMGYTNDWFANCAVDGSWTQQWLPTPTYSHNAGAANVYLGTNFSGSIVNNTASNFNTYSDPGCYINRALANATIARGSGTVGANDYVHIMLITNETTGNAGHPKGPLTVANHAINMAAIVAAFVAAGYKVIMSKPPYTWPYANLASNLPWAPADYSNQTDGFPAGFTSYTTNYPHEVYHQMWLADMPLVNNTNVFIGDTTAFEYSAANPYTFLQSTQNMIAQPTFTAYGIHPAYQAQALYAQMWANGMAYAMGVTQSGGGGSGTGGRIIGG